MKKKVFIVMKYLMLIAFMALFFSCNENVKIAEKKLTVDIEIDALSDSTFFKQMLSLVFNDGKLYCAEESRSQILVLDENLKLINAIGNLGQGPEDILYASFITVFKDTVIIKGGNQRMQLFHSDGKFIGSEKTCYETCFWPYCRFVYKNNIFIGDARDSDTYAHVKCSPDLGAVKYFGERYKFPDPVQEKIRNNRYLLDGGDYLISVSDNVPIIEKYDYETGRLLSIFDLSKIEPIKTRMKEADAVNKNNSYLCYVLDCNIFNDKVYLLCNMTTDRYYANTVVVLDCIDDFKVDSKYSLPSNSYRSIAINDKYLYAFASAICKLQRFKL